MSATGVNKPLKDQMAEQELFRRRAWIGFVSVVCLTVLLAARYCQLQILRHEDYSTRSESNQVQLRAVPPSRGLIYDRRGRILAHNEAAYRLEVVPEQTGDLENTLDALAALVTITEDDRRRFERARDRYLGFEGVPLRFDLDEGEVSRVAVNGHRFEGVEVVPYLSRSYPYADLLTHALGYVGRMDRADLSRVEAGNYRGTTHIGKLGVEKSYEDVLHGTVGLERVEANARGRVLRVLERLDPVPGSDLILSIDVRVQQAAWEALGDDPGAVVAIDPRDGSVIAMVSKPSFDPNLFVHGIRQEAYEAILAAPYRPLFNRALAGGYEPGSTMKPFIALAGLELGVVSREHRTYSSGEYYLPDYERPFRDWKEGGHGWVEVRTALAESVNTYFYELAYALGIDRMHDYLTKFGFGQRTGIDLPGEGVGVLPSREWKRSRYDEPWYPGETIIAGIGQGFNVATPLQLANALAVLVSRGARRKPRMAYAIKAPGSGTAERQWARLVERVPVVDGDNWDIVLEGMRQVVNSPRGTASDVSLDTDYVIAGKTGTSQVFALNRERDYDAEELEEALRDHALFIAFAPFRRPRIVVAVVVEHGGAGSRAAAPVARAALDAWLQQESGI